MTQAQATCEPGQHKHKHKKNERALVLASSQFTCDLFYFISFAIKNNETNI